MEKEQISLITEKPDFDISISDLKEVVNKYMQREHGSDDVDFLINKGGYKWLEQGIRTDLKNGLTDNSFEEREKYFGTNKKEKIIVPSLWHFFIEAFEDILLRVLLVAGSISIILDMIVQTDNWALAWIEGFSIIFAALFVAFFQALNNKKKETEFQKLNDQMISGKTVQVMRYGVEDENLVVGDIQVGDIVFLKQGMEIPGDGILINGFSIKVDESSMTGETKAMNKESINKCLEKKLEQENQGIQNISHTSIPSPVILSGTKVVSGTGTMIVINIGNNSAIGKIQEIVVTNNNEMTPLQLKLEMIARNIGIFGLVSALIIFISLVIWSLVLGSQDKWSKGGSYYAMQIVNAFLLGVTILVVAIPEGLPLAVTLSLAFAVNKMLKDQNLVRQLHACETMAGANIICSDKTGTLTKNQMEATNLWNGIDMVIYDDSTATLIDYTQFIKSPNIQDLFVNTICLNSTEDPNKENGNPTEKAILKYLTKCNVDVVGRREIAEKVFEASFSSDRKRMSTVIKMSDGKCFVFMKGASEYTLNLCKNWICFETEILKEIDEGQKKTIEKTIQQMAMKSLRTIGICYKEVDFKSLDFNSQDERGVYEFEKDGFTLLCLFGIRDTIREEVPLSIQQCKQAGIQVKMVTGDNKITARAIAYSVGIINSHNESRALVMEGPEFLRKIGGVICKNCKDLPKCDCVWNEYELQKPENKNKKIRDDTIQNQEEFDKICNDLVVLARSRPEDKYALVVGLKERNNIVAVTGDGTNDAPALRKANVGFAMGVAGTEIAKQAADILIMDDNFASIVKAVKWGRNINISIQKFLQFQVTVNIVSVTTSLISTVAINQPIFSAVQMMWINMIMDSLGALALATEPPTDELLKQRPKKKDDSIITPIMLKHIILQSFFQIVVLIIVLFLGDKFLFDTIRKLHNQKDSILIVSGLEIFGYDTKKYGDYSMHFTYIFNIFVMQTYFNFFNCRMINDEKNIFANIKKSHYFIGIMFAILILQIIFLTFTGPAIKVVQWGLDPLQWLLCIGIGMLGIVFDFIVKFIPMEKLFKGLGTKEIKKEEFSKLSTLALKKRHDSTFFQRNSIVSQRVSQITSRQKL